MSSQTNSLNNCELPDKLSDLIKLAISDLEKCEKSPDYLIDMGTWHSPSNDGKLCAVCLAGSVMAQTCKMPFQDSLNTFIVKGPLWDKFRALDDIRLYRIATVLQQFYPESTVDFYGIQNTILKTISKRESYSSNSVVFKQNMLAIADKLAELGY